MQIINNRYRVERFVEQDVFGSKYVVVDLIQNNNRFFLYVVNNEELSKPLIKFCIDNFLEISARKISGLFEVVNFGVIDSIDDKYVSDLIYFYTTEYLDPNLIVEFRQPLPKDELIDVYVQLARTIDYLHFCGENYKYIHPGTVTLFRVNGQIRAKLMDIISLKKEEFFNKYNREFYDFEFLEESNQRIKKSAEIDIFAFGTYLYYLFTTEYFNKKSLYNLCKNLNNYEEQWKTSFISVVNRMVRVDENKKYKGIHDVNKDIKDAFGLDYIIEDKTQVDRLNFNIPMVGRESELNNAIRAIEQKRNKLVLIRGAGGIGKSRLIDEVCYRMKLKKYNVFSVSCNSHNAGFHSIISSLLRQVIKLSERNTILKYAKEIVKIIPDMVHSYNVTPSKELPEDREILRLFDRASNFIVDTLDQRPTIITITNFSIVNQTVVEFIDYLQKLCSVKKSNITLLIGITETEHTGAKSEHYVKKWLYDENVIDIELNRLSIQETAKMFRYISGWHKEPLRLATSIMEKTEGIPAFIGEAIREMYNRGALRIDYADEGGGFAWHLDEEDYDKIVKLDNIDDTVKKQLLKFNKETKEVLDIISIFDISVSSETIKKMSDKSKDVSTVLNKLIQLGILQEELNDRGFSYSFRSNTVKEFVYKNIEKNKRLSMHKLACSVLEELFKNEGVENKKELIHHLNLSNQKSKAVDYYIELGENVFKLNVFTQALHFYKSALKLIDDAEDVRKNMVLEKIGDIRIIQGDAEGALQIFESLLKKANEINNIQQVIDLNNKIANILLNRNEQVEAEEKLAISIMQAEKIKYYDGLLKAVDLLTRVYKNSREMEKLSSIIDKFLPIAIKVKNNEYTGKLLSQRGILEFYREDLEKSLDYFKRSIAKFEEANMIKEASRPYNNIGVILHDYLRDSEKAKTYFEKALEISKQYHVVDIMIIVQTNLAEIYIEENNYYEAIELLNKSVDLAAEYGEESLKFNANLNLIRCYIRLFDYDSASNYLRHVQKDVDINKGVIKNVEEYYKTVLEFMSKLGKYNEVVMIVEKAVMETVKMDKRAKTEIETYKFFAEVILNNEIDEMKLSSLISKISEASSYIYYRMILLKAAEYYSVTGKQAEAEKLLKEDKKLIEIFDNKYLDLYRRYIRGSLVETEELFEQLLIELLPTSFEELKWKTYSKIGSIQIDNGAYFKAVNSLLSALDIIESIASKIPNEYLDSYLLHENKYKIAENLQYLHTVIETHENKDSLEKPPRVAAKMNDGIEKNSIDVAKFRELFQSDKFYELALENYKEEFPSDVNCIEEIVSSLTSGMITNLSLILDFIGMITLATKGAIIGINDNKTEIITHFGNDIDLGDIDYLFSKIANSPDNMVLENKYGKGKRQRGTNDFVGRSSIEMMCIPIEIVNDAEGKVSTEQRKWKNIEQSKILGYIYLETGRIFSNFTIEVANKCKSLIPLISLIILNHNLSFESSMDKMTGIYNRAYFEKKMNEKIEEAKKMNLSFSIIMCDVDHFKSVNDRFGHQRGDLILKNTGRIIKESVREADVVGRYGGEEFIILLTETNKKDAFYVAENIRLKFSNAMLLGKDDKLTISCGVANYPEDAIHKDLIIEKADVALYSAKESGRNATAMYKEGLEIEQNRADKLAGIITGNSIQDQRNMLAIIETLEIMLDKKSTKDKMFIALGRLIEVIEAEDGIIFLVEENMIKEKMSRKRFVDEWYEDVNYNESLISKTIETRKGDFLIDWENISHIDILTGTPNWKSVIVSPIIAKDELKGIVLLSVSAREKEFDFNAFNFARLMCNIMGFHI